jgi:hypothetical protein
MNGQQQDTSAGTGNWFDQNAAKAGGAIPQGGAAPPSGGANWFTQNAAATTAAQDTSSSLTDNPNKEGLYRFVDMSKAPTDNAQAAKNYMLHAPVIYVPYSKALDLLGHPEYYRGLSSDETSNDVLRLQSHVNQQFNTATNPMQQTGVANQQYVIHPDEVKHLFNSYSSDPNFAATRRGNIMRADPVYQTGIGATREAARTAVGLHDIVAGRPEAGQESGVRKFAEAPQENPNQQLGGVLETGGEFVGGEELLGLLGKATKSLVTLKDAAQVEAEIQKGSTLGKLAQSAIKNATVSGAQSLAKTGGDIREAGKSAGEMGLAGLVFGGVGAGITKGVEGVKGATAARAAEEAAGAGARQAKYLDALDDYKWKQAKYDYQIKNAEYDRQVAAIDKQHDTNVAAARAQHDAQAPQREADANAQYQRDLEAAHTAHNARLEEWKAQHKEAIDTARAHFDAAEKSRATEHAEATAAGEKDYEQRQAAATEKAQTAAETAQKQETARVGTQYAETARGAVEPHLRALEEAGQPRQVTMAQPGGGPGAPAGQLIHEKPLVQFDTNEVLSRVGDYTGARTELQNSLNQASEAMDQATGGQFGKLKGEVADAQNRMYKGGNKAEDVAAYQQKLTEMDQLIGGTRNVSPKFAEAVRSGWRQYYIMGDLTTGLDKAVRGVPGDTAVSQVQRGIDGKILTDNLSRLVRTHGRPAVEAALGGADRLRALDEIGQQTSTNGGRQSLNKSVVDVARYMEPVEPASVPPPFKAGKFEAPTPATPKPKFVAPEKPKVGKFEEPEKPAYPEKPEAPAPRPPKPPKEPTLEEPEAGLSAGKVARAAGRKVVASLAWGLGYSHGGPIGGAMAAGAAEGSMKAGSMAVQRVQNAMMSDPKVARFLLYAARNGGDPKIYGPMIAGMINSNQKKQQPQELQKPSPVEIQEQKPASKEENVAPSGPGYPKPVVAGNIQWYNRPQVDTSSIKAGTTGTVYSASREQNGLEVLYPLIYDGALHTDAAAWQHYKDTGQHMGKFAHYQDADAYAQKYHEDAEAGKYGAFTKSTH